MLVFDQIRWVKSNRQIHLAGFNSSLNQPHKLAVTSDTFTRYFKFGRTLGCRQDSIQHYNNENYEGIKDRLLPILSY